MKAYTPSWITYRRNRTTQGFFLKTNSKSSSHTRMLKAKGPEFQKTLFFLMHVIWDCEIYPYEWSKALFQPIYTGEAEPRIDPASYRGIYLTFMTNKLFEGILNERLVEFTTKHDTLTPFQFGSKKGHQNQLPSVLISSLIIPPGIARSLISRQPTPQSTATY